MVGFGAKVKLSVDRSTAAKAEFNEQINSLTKQIKISNKFVVLQKDMDRVRTSAQTMLNKSPIKITNIDCSQAVTKLRKDLQNVINSLSIKNGVSITGLVDPTGAGTIATQIDNIADAAARGQGEVNRFNAQMSVLKETMSSLATAYKSVLPGGKNAITDAAQLDALTQRYTALKQKIEEIRSANSIASQEQMTALQNEAVAIQNEIAQINQARIAREQSVAAAKQAEKAKQDAAKAAANAESEYRAQLDKVNSLIVQTKKNLDSWGASKVGKTSDEYAKIQEYVAELDALRAELVLSGKASDDFGNKFGALKTEIGTSSAIIKEAGENTKTFSDRIGGLASKFTSWLTVSQVIMRLYRAIKEMVSVVVEVDTAMTELKKVTDETNATYTKFLDNAIDRAKKLGATLSDIVTASADFARLGYNIDDAEKLADVAIVYKNVGDGIEDINDASESIIATMQAFDINAGNAMSIVDKFNEVGNKYAISSMGVGEALLRSAASMKAANNTLDETIALAAAANTIVQNPEKVGTTLKTVSMYLRAAKTEAEEAGEATDGMVSSVSELREELLALTAGKVDIQIDEDSFKSTYQILKELSKVWGTLTDITRANILEMVGGKRNANVVAALLENFTIAENALETSANSAGSALAENEKYLESIEGKISKFKATFEELSTTLIGSDFVKQIVEFGTGLLSVLNAVARLIDSIGGLNTVLVGTVGIIAAIKLDSLIKLISVTLPAALIKLIKPLTTVVTAIGRAPAVFKSFRNGTALAIPGTSKFSTALKALGISASTAQIAIGALTIAITAAIAIYQHHQQVLAEQRDAAIDAANSFNNASASIDEYKERIASLKGAIDSGNLSESEACDRRQELIDIQKSLVEMFGKEAEGIDLVTKSIESQSNAIDNLVDKKWDEFKRNNTSAINDTIDLFTDFKPSKIDFWNSPSVGGFRIDVPSSSDLFKAIEDLDLDIVPADFHKKLEEKLIDADIGIEIPVTGITGSFVSDLDVNSIYDALDVYQKLYDITEDLGKEYFGENYLDYVGVALEGYSAQIKQIQDSITESESIFNTYVDGLLSSEQEYSKIWGNILAAKKEYDEAVASGDSNLVETALAGMQAAEDEFLNAGWDNNAVNLYVKEFFDDWKSAAEEYEFGEALSSIDKIKSLFDSGEINVNEYKDAIKQIIQELKDAGFSEDGIKELELSLDIEGLEGKISKIKDKIKDITDNDINKMSGEDIKIAYQIIESSSTEYSFDELLEQIERVKLTSGEMVNVFDFSEMIHGMDDAKEGIEGIISAMDQLREGTALTKEQLANLALQYPKLLEASNLFTDGSIAGQEDMLNSILEMHEAAYDAQIDEKIAELEATKEAIDAQLELEAEKAALIDEIDLMSKDGEIHTAQEYVNKIRELNDLQGQNYVELKNGELRATTAALEKFSNAESTTASGIVKNIWQPFARSVSSAQNKGLKGGLTGLQRFAAKLRDALSSIVSRIWNPYANDVKNAQGGKATNTVSGVSIDTSFDTSGTDIVVDYNGNDVMVGDYRTGEWVSAQKEASEQRIAQLNQSYQRTTNAIANLERLKGLDLTSTYGKAGTSGSSSGSSKSDLDDKQKEIEEYIADIDAYYAAEKRLEAAINNAESISKKMKATDDPSERIKLSSELIKAYNDEMQAEEDLVNLKRLTIKQNAASLRALGFEVEYNAKANDFEIKNLEHLNQLTATSTGKYETLQDATNALRKETEELIGATEDLNDDNIKAISTMEDLGYEILDVRKDIINSIEDIYDKQVDAYQEVINKRKEMIKSAKDEYDYEADIAEKVKEIADLQSRIDQLALDDSRSAQAERASLMQELDEKQQELADTQGDHATDSQLDALDKMAEDYEQQRADEIEIMRNTVTESEELWNAFYQTILGNTAIVGASVDEHIANAWIRAARAVNDYSAAMSGISSGGVVINSIPKYHTGGVVDEANVGKDETLALLEKGEVVLNDGKQQTLYKIIDFQEELSKRLGTVIGSLVLPDITGSIRSLVGDAVSNITEGSQSLVFEPHIQVEINHSGTMNDTDAKSYGEKIADTAIEKLYSAFERRGISSTRASRLKP